MYNLLKHWPQSLHSIKIQSSRIFTFNILRLLQRNTLGSDTQVHLVDGVSVDVNVGVGIEVIGSVVKDLVSVGVACGPVQTTLFWIWLLWVIKVQVSGV